MDTLWCIDGQMEQWSESWGFWCHIIHVSGLPRPRETIPLLDIDLETVEEKPWRTAWEKVFAEQSLYNQMVGDALKAVLRIWGWISLDIALYQEKASIWKAFAIN